MFRKLNFFLNFEVSHYLYLGAVRVFSGNANLASNCDCSNIFGYDVFFGFFKKVRIKKLYFN